MMTDPRIDSERRLPAEPWTAAIDRALDSSQFPTVGVYGIEPAVQRGLLAEALPDRRYAISQPRENGGELYGATLRPMTTRAAQPLGQEPAEVDRHAPPATGPPLEFVAGTLAMPTATRSLNFDAFSGKHGPRAYPSRTAGMALVHGQGLRAITTGSPGPDRGPTDRRSYKGPSPYATHPGRQA
jgi:hypothetical protein